MKPYTTDVETLYEDNSDQKEIRIPGIHPKLAKIADVNAKPETGNDGRGWSGYPMGTDDTNLEDQNEDAKNDVLETDGDAN